MKWFTEEEQKRIKLLITNELLNCEIMKNRADNDSITSELIQKRIENYENLKVKFDELCERMNEK